MRIIIAATACLALLGGCSDGGADADGDGTITEQEVAAEAASSGEIKMRAGEWENTIEFTEFDIPGVPEGMKDMIAGQMGKSITAKSCLTQEEADKPDAGFFNGEKNDDCTYDEFDRSGGKLKLRMTCDTDESGGSAKIAMDGKFGRDSFTMTMSNVVSGSENGDVTMKGTISGKRIGDCAG